ncbi:hypothetical protein ARALYDRAFT_915809 [Arabidopsis lyrata subsp. lyrata]|uniref:NAC domain-containing protein n=1 Tax=Arabidopsis lyrata subsp. lyrata TaxID=81972 RepID=D7MI61_ARALL|nr:hypothetical protein ARALYDRAFT_915809 [Arabidopsis lyrata subsp. lyrata]
MSIPTRNKRKERCSPEPQTQPPSENLSSSSLAADNMPPPSTLAYILPPGYQFVPSDQQLIFCYFETLLGRLQERVAQCSYSSREYL